MDLVEARSYFADKLIVDCPVCTALVGELCVENNGVWIHLERFVAAETVYKELHLQFMGSVDAESSAFLHALRSLEEVFLRNQTGVSPELRTAFIKMSLVKADLHQKTKKLIDDHPTLFNTEKEST